MNVVLYTRELDPITVIDLPLWLLDQLERQGTVRVAVVEPPSWTELSDPLDFDEPKVVTIECQRLRLDANTTKQILVTDDDELALRLKPEWLPGQRAQVNQYKRNITQLTQQLVKALRK